MLQKMRTILPLVIVVAFVLICTGFGLTSRTQSENTKSEEAVNQNSELNNYELPDNTAISENAEEEKVDPYGNLVDADGYYDTGDSGYVLTDRERNLVERAVMCEAGGEGERGEMMIAQSILDGALRNNYSISQEIKAYGVATTCSGKVSEEVSRSVRLVFDEGKRVTMEKTDLWYNPALVVSLWHEEQQYVITVGNHRFFWMNNDI